MDWQLVGMAMLSLVFVLYGLAYMIGIGFMLPKVKAWAKNEFYQAVVSALILGGMIGLLASMNGLVNSLMGLPGDSSCEPFCSPDGSTCNCAIKAGVDFFNARITAMTAISGSMIALNLAIGVLSNMRIQGAPHQQGFGIMPFGGLTVANDLLGIVMQFCGMGIGLLWVNKILLEFVGSQQLMAMFPIGCVLRAFPWTRGAGAAMIALCVGLYVVFPLLVVVETWVVPRDLANVPSDCSLNPLDWDDCLVTWFVQISYTVVIVTMFLPVFILTLSFAFIKEFGRLMGGDIDVSNLAKLL